MCSPVMVKGGWILLIVQANSHDTYPQYSCVHSNWVWEIMGNWRGGRISSRIEGYRVAVQVVTKPSHIKVKMHGWSQIFCLYRLSLLLKSIKSLAQSGWLYSSRCLASSGACWQDGHSFDPWCRWGDAQRGSLSWMNRMIHCWSSSWKEESVDLTRFQLTFLKSCSIHWYLFCIACW